MLIYAAVDIAALFVVQEMKVKQNHYRHIRVALPQSSEKYFFSSFLLIFKYDNYYA